MWAEKVYDQYVAAGYRCEIGWANTEKTEGYVRILGLEREALCQHLNDPLGEPGNKVARHPASGRHKRRQPKTAEEYHDWECAREEARYLRPDD